MHTPRSRGSASLKTSGRNGFTLIELLVVIAVIGILSAVVLASLGLARNKGIDAGIQSELSSIQQEAELYFSVSGGNTYGSQRSTAGCPTTSGAGSMFYSDSNIKDDIITANQTSSGTINGGGVTSNVYCSANISGTNGGSNFVVEATLVNGVTVGGTTYKVWCVDSSGNAKPETSLGTGLGACP